jgi:hypothetical protein
MTMLMAQHLTVPGLEALILFVLNMSQIHLSMYDKLVAPVMNSMVSKYYFSLILIIRYLPCLDWDGVRNFVSAMPKTIKRLILVSSIGVTKYNEIPWRYTL